jgi:circadian clock protein KaiC
MNLSVARADGCLSIQQIDPAELSPGEFSHAVCKAAEDGAKVVVIDSLSGYLQATPDERFLTTHLHELLTYLGQRGVITIVVGVHHGIIGTSMQASVDASYLADNVILLRHFEIEAEVRQAVSVFKKRGGKHERTLRPFSMSSEGISVGPVLRQFHGILTGVPSYNGRHDGDLEGTHGK